MVQTRTSWQQLITEVSRAPFIPDTVWVDIDASHPQSGFVALSKQGDSQRWWELVGANEPVITQVDDGRTAVGATGWSPSTLLCVVKGYFKIEFWLGELGRGVTSRGLRVGAAGS